MSQFTRTTSDFVLKDSPSWGYQNLEQHLFSLYHLETISHDGHPRKFLPLVKMLEAKHSSLWSSLSFSKQEKLLTLLEQMKPEEQDCLLRVVMNQGQASHSYVCYMYTYSVAELLSLLTRLHSTDRLTLLRLLEPMDRQEQRKLIRVMDSLKDSERVELLGILDGLEALEQQTVLNVLDSITRSLRILRYGYVSDNIPHTETVLNLMKNLLPVERTKLLRLLDGLQSTSEWLLFLLLKHCSQCHKLAEMIYPLKQCMNALGPPERKQLKRVLRKLQSKLALSDSKFLMQMEYESLLQRLLLLFVCLLSIYLYENGPQGGFKNLLLDGWWLEFWEIILLAAGDVERNPGPTFMTEKELAAVSNAIIEEDDLSEIFDNVLPISSKWYQFCSILGLRPSLLDTFSEKCRGDCDRCLFEGVKHWLQGNYNIKKHGPPTWRKLVTAIDNSAGGSNHALAKTIAEKHKALPTVPPQLQVIDSLHKDHRRFEEMSSSFNSMYRSVVRLLRNVDVGEVKEHLCYLTVPKEFDKLCVPRHVYECAATTKDLMGQLCPQYINPRNTFVLEEIVTNFGSRRCKKLVQDYLNKFM